MDSRNKIVAIIIQEGSKLVSEYIRSRPIKPKGHDDYQVRIVSDQEEDIEQPKEGQDVATGCVVCAIGHLGTCNGLLSESMRFARKDGLASDEVIVRINHCLDELNAMEREDLTPAKIVNLPSWEKDLAIDALNASRDTRHKLESISDVDQLEQISASTETTRQHIGKEFFKRRLSNMSREEKLEIAERAIEKLEGEES